MLKTTPINTPKVILVDANIHTPPNRLKAAHTAKIIKKI
jgi:hypothetical protein